MSSQNRMDMKINSKWIVYFLRYALAIGFLSAVADRFGLWPQEISAWGNWPNFVAYTGVLNPWLLEAMIPATAILATGLEILFGVLLIVGYKIEWVAKVSGILLLLFALSMVFSSGLKVPFDYSVFTASAAAFALGSFGELTIKPF